MRRDAPSDPGRSAFHEEERGTICIDGLAEGRSVCRVGSGRIGAPVRLREQLGGERRGGHVARGVEPAEEHPQRDSDYGQDPCGPKQLPA